VVATNDAWSARETRLAYLTRADVPRSPTVALKGYWGASLASELCLGYTRQFDLRMAASLGKMEFENARIRDCEALVWAHD
jgi:hypothetical protein